VNDREAAEVLGGIDAPRSLPRSLHAALLDSLTDPLAAIGDERRDLPADLRARLEASMLGARPMPVPPTVRARVVRELQRPRRIVSVAAAAVVLLVVGLLTVVTNGSDPPSSTAGGPRPPTSRPGADIAPSSSLPGAGTAGAASGGSTAVGGTAAAPPFTDTGSSAPPGDVAPDSASPAAGGASVGSDAVLVAVQPGDAAIEAGFNAYLGVLNASGGVRGRRVAIAEPDAAGAVARVNLGGAPTARPETGVLFETAYVDDGRLTGPVVSMASALERQARLAVASAFPEDGGSAVIVVGRTEPWVTTVPNALAGALQSRGVAAVRVPLDGADAAAAVADAVFLSLSPAEVGEWLERRTGDAPPRGTWGVGSAWQDGLAAAGADAGLRVLSPYAPVDGDERAALAAALDEPLSAGAVHGWVTAKALAFLLHANGGVALQQTDLDALGGWDPRWAPPYAVREGTRSRTPDAIVLRPDGDRFLADGAFVAEG